MSNCNGVGVLQAVRGISQCLESGHRVCEGCPEATHCHMPGLTNSKNNFSYSSTQMVSEHGSLHQTS